MHLQSFHSFLFQLYWDVSDKQHCMSWCTACWFDTFIYCKKDGYYSCQLTRPSCHITPTSFLWWEHLRGSLRKFQINNIVILTIITSCISGLTHIINGSFQPFSNPLISPFPSTSHPLPAPSKHHSTICFYELGFFSFHR